MATNVVGAGTHFFLGMTQEVPGLRERPLIYLTTKVPDSLGLTADLNADRFLRLPVWTDRCPRGGAALC